MFYLILALATMIAASRFMDENLNVAKLYEVERNRLLQVKYPYT